MTPKEAIKAIKCNYPPERYSMLREALNMAIDALEKQNKEAEPVRRGHWEFCAESVETMWNCKCSVCGSIEQPLQRHRYCPNCGAKMEVDG